MADDVNRSDELEVEGHAETREPVEKQAPRSEDEPEVEGHRLALDPDKAADPQKQG